MAPGCARGSRHQLDGCRGGDRELAGAGLGDLVGERGELGRSVVATAVDEEGGRAGDAAGWFAVIADATSPRVLYESGFAPRWYVPRADVDETARTPVDVQTFCPYKGLAGYYDIGEHHGAAWSYRDAWPDVGRISDMVSFEPDKVEVYLDNVRQHLEPGQAVVAHGVDRGLDPDEILERGSSSLVTRAWRRTIGVWSRLRPSGSR